MALFAAISTLLCLQVTAMNPINFDENYIEKQTLKDELTEAASKNDLSAFDTLVKKFMSKKPDQEQKYKILQIKTQDEGYTALHLAVKSDDIEMVKQLLFGLSLYQKYDIVSSNTCIGTALMIAAYMKNVQIINLLLDGFSEEQKYALLRTQHLNKTALHIATDRVSRDALEALLAPLAIRKQLELGTTAQTFLDLLNIKNEDGITVLELAQKNKLDSIVKYLTTVLHRANKIIERQEKSKAQIERKLKIQN